MDEPLLSIVIVNYNAAALLGDCLGSLRAHAPPFKHEVLIADNASTDGSMEFVAENYPDVHWVGLADNLGFAAGNNRGVAYARGRYLLLLNPDTRVRAGAVEAMVQFLMENPGVGVLGVRQEDGRGWPQLAYGDDPTFLGEARRRRTTLGLFRGREQCRRKVDGRFAEPADVDWVAGACMAMPRRVYTRLGGMDEAFWLYFEDCDLCRRVRRAGWRVTYHPGVTIFHRRDAVMDKTRPPALVAYRVSQKRYARLYLGHVAVAWVRLLCLARGVLAYLSRPPGLTRPQAVWVGRQLMRIALLGSPTSRWRQGRPGMDTRGAGG